jgi:hypothetical protein
MRRYALLPLWLFAVPSVALAQGMGTPSSMPMVVNLKKVEIGTYADYAMSAAGMTLTSRWALVGKSAKSCTVETVTTASILPHPVAVRMQLPLDPTAATNKSLGKVVMQMGDADPMFAPADVPEPKFQKPDPKNLVGPEEIKVKAGTYKTLHYRETNANATVDLWVSDRVPPLGMVKVVNTPKVDPKDPKSMRVGPSTMELAAVGKGQKAVITKKPKAFDPKKMGVPRGK